MAVQPPAEIWCGGVILFRNGIRRPEIF